MFLLCPWVKIKEQPGNVDDPSHFPPQEELVDVTSFHQPCNKSEWDQTGLYLRGAEALPYSSLGGLDTVNSGSCFYLVPCLLNMCREL